MGYRDYKEFAPGAVYHIYNRGNAKMDIFLDEEDYAVFLTRLRILLGKGDLPMVPMGKWQRRQRVRPFLPEQFLVHSYCLMPNHFHLIIEQNTDLAISALMLKLCTGYAKYFNRKYQRAGHVLQDQFSAVLVENDIQLGALSAYVHQNPKVSGLVSHAEDWEFSSYRTYLGLRTESLCHRDLVMSGFRDVLDYKDFVEGRYKEILERKEIQGLMID